jgi:hypothetical protein
MQFFSFADLINSEQVLILSSLLFVAVIWQTATVLFLRDEDAIVLPNPKNCSNGFLFRECNVNVLDFNIQILFRICNPIQK